MSALMFELLCIFTRCLLCCYRNAPFFRISRIKSIYKIKVNTYLLIEHPLRIISQVVLLVCYHQQYGERQKKCSSSQESDTPSQSHHTEVPTTHYYTFKLFNSVVIHHKYTVIRFGDTSFLILCQVILLWKLLH